MITYLPERYAFDFKHVASALTEDFVPCSKNKYGFVAERFQVSMAVTQEVQNFACSLPFKTRRPCILYLAAGFAIPMHTDYFGQCTLLFAESRVRDVQILRDEETGVKSINAGVLINTQVSHGTLALPDPAFLLRISIDAPYYETMNKL